MTLDPQTTFSLFNAIATAGRTIYDIAQGTTKLEEKQQLMAVYDQLMNLKRSAADLEDENYGLKQKLRFKGDEFEFKNPFWFEKKHPDRALCPKCWSKQIAAPVGQPYDNDFGIFRRCLTCDTPIQEGPSRKAQHRSRGPDFPGEWS